MDSGKEQIRWRHEIKYMCSVMQMAVIENKISVFCDIDEHAGTSGQYTVRSLYFDDCHDNAYYENETGVDPRQKYRIRLYNGDIQHLFLERKRKQNGKTYKESISFPVEQCAEILQGDWFCFDMKDRPPLFQQFYLEYRTKLLRPKMIVEYERVPYIYSAGNVRITFDKNISACGNVEDFLQKELITRPVMPEGQHILEEKYDALIPDYLYNALSGEKLRQTTYSKYYICRKICEGR